MKATNSFEVTDLTKVKRSLHRFFLIKRNNCGLTCELCLKPFDIQGNNSISSSLTSDTLKIVLSSFLAPCNIQTSHLSCSLTLCHSCILSFTKLANAFHELERLRVEFNDLRMSLGVKVIEGSLGTSADEWKREVQQAEAFFPSCVGSMKKLKDVGIGTETDWEFEDSSSSESGESFGSQIPSHTKGLESQEKVGDILKYLIYIAC